MSGGRLPETAAHALQLNRAHWNDRADMHARDATGFYRVDAFKAGADTLTPIESAELGVVEGKTLLHLQCHFGLDTLSLARRGARVTGLDFSSRAIVHARRLADEVGVEATFVEGDVHDARALIPGTFDIVFATWGVFCWIPDVTRWLAVAASMLAPGGRLYLADDHPTANQIEEEVDANGQARLVVAEHWRTAAAQPNAYVATHSYTGDATPIANTAVREWVHPISAFFDGIERAGLRLAWFREHDAIPWQRYPSMVRAAGELWRLPADRRAIPLAFSLLADKP